MMKKEILIILVIAGSLAALSAEGKQDSEEQYYGRGPGMMGGRYSETDRTEWLEQREAAKAEYLESLETVSLTGELLLVNGELPQIESDGIKYYIMAPWYNLGEIELTNGMTVSVEGYEMPGRPLQWDGSEKSLMVTKAVINGEEIVIEHPMDGSGFRRGYNCYNGAGSFGRQGGAGRKGGVRGGMMGPRFN